MNVHVLLSFIETFCNLVPLEGLSEHQQIANWEQSVSCSAALLQPISTIWKYWKDNYNSSVFCMQPSDANKTWFTRRMTCGMCMQKSLHPSILTFLSFLIILVVHVRSPQPMILMFRNDVTSHLIKNKNLIM